MASIGYEPDEPASGLGRESSTRSHAFGLVCATQASGVLTEWGPGRPSRRRDHRRPRSDRRGVPILPATAVGPARWKAPRCSPRPRPW